VHDELRAAGGALPGFSDHGRRMGPAIDRLAAKGWIRKTGWRWIVSCAPGQ
jgi:hypothetical protein